MPRQLSANELIRRRIQKWEDEDPSSLLTKKIEKATASLQWLVALMLPDTLIKEIVEKTVWAAEALTDRDDVFKTLEQTSLAGVKSCKLERCDALADQVHGWAIGTAAAAGAWDLVGPLGLAPSLITLFTLAFRTIKKIGLCYGYDTSSHFEEMIAIEIFVAASTLYHREKIVALKDIEKIRADFAGKDMTQIPREAVMESILKLSRPISENLTRRRTFASVPAMGALVGSSTNAWLLKDVGWAARNIYAGRRLEEARQLRDKKAAEAANAPAAPATGTPDKIAA